MIFQIGDKVLLCAIYSELQRAVGFKKSLALILCMPVSPHALAEIIQGHCSDLAPVLFLRVPAEDVVFPAYLVQNHEQIA